MLNFQQKQNKKTISICFVFLSPVYVFVSILLFIKLHKPEVTCLPGSSAQNFFSHIHLQLYYSALLENVLQNAHRLFQQTISTS